MEPKITTGNYISSFYSRYHPWFCDMGYPRLDVLEHDDGEWAIIQLESTAIIPAETKWRRVLQGMQNVEISYSFIKKYLEEIDIQRRAFWDREEARSKAVEAEYEAKERHAHDSADRAFAAIRQNPALMERISRNGLREMDPRRILRHVPTYRM